MRISTNVLFDSGSARLSDLQSSLVRLQNQLSTGNRVLTPADDPIAAARALEVTQAQSANEQFKTNRQNVKGALSLEESVLQSVTSRLQDVQTLIVDAGNGALDDQQRKFKATELSGIFDDLLSLANSRDGTGGYIFSGYQTNTQPFSKTSTGAQYAGDQGQQMLQVGASRQLAASDSGAAVFELNRTGNGSFATAAATTNTGTGVVSTGSVVDSTLLTKHTYDITFTVTNGVTTYDVTDTTTSTTVSTGNAYVDGQAISFDGLQFDIKGAPANGDKFTVEPSRNQNIFETLTNLIAALNTPATGGAGQAALSNALNAASNNVSNALDNVLTVRASVGIRLKEIDALDDQGDSLNTQYEQQIEQLTGLDYASAISDFTKQSTILEAAQQSFVKTSKMSLFDFL